MDETRIYTHHRRTSSISQLEDDRRQSLLSLEDAYGIADSRRSSRNRRSLMLEQDEQQDWEELLRQYDRYDSGDVAAVAAASVVNDKRRSKRASRIIDPFSEPPAEMPRAEDPTVVLDCYDFPSAFKTHHLHDIFREYENMRGGYRIKWMDDTRALIIFEHPTTAKKAYIDNVSNPLAKIRPYSGPTDFLKSSMPTTPRRPTSIDLKRASFNGAGGFGLKSPVRPTSIRG
ncbi:hypothetical protein BX666DRAFT_1971749 [Dichotomocladium elegans]|nr:hypothetical protein BX666DRAFT_1971749 [Dichotomocladium elegans]